MNLKFWKKKTENDASAKGAPDRDGEAASAKAGLFSRIGAQAAALIGRFRPPPPFKAEVPGGEAEPPTGKESSPELDSVPAASVLVRAQASLAGLLRAAPEGETQPTGRMALIVAGLLLLLLLLGAFGYAAWTIVLSSPDPKADVAELITDEHANAPPLPIVMPESAPTASDVPEVRVGEDAASTVPAAEMKEEEPASSVAKTESVAEHPAPASSPAQIEVEALRQKNEALQAELDALKKARQSAAAVKMYPGGKGEAAGGVATVGSSDPKAAAATLKDAIDAMNNGKNYRQNPAR